MKNKIQFLLSEVSTLFKVTDQFYTHDIQFLYLIYLTLLVVKYKLANLLTLDNLKFEIYIFLKYKKSLILLYAMNTRYINNIDSSHNFFLPHTSNLYWEVISEIYSTVWKKVYWILLVYKITFSEYFVLVYFYIFTLVV